MSIEVQVRAFCWGRNCGNLDVDAMLAMIEQDETELREQLAAANARAETAEWQDAGFCSQCGADRVRTSTDDIDAPLLHTLSYCVACGAFWVWDHEAKNEVQP